MEVEGRTVRFCDLAYFMDNEARVAEEDCSFLSSCGGLGATWRKIVKNAKWLCIFWGVPSSPACSNSALHKIVDDNVNHYPRKVIKNFNVNNCLKFLPSTTDASQYITDLQSMLSRGGSWLEKWVGNSRSDFDAMREAGISEVKNLNLSKNNLLVERALGFWWCVEAHTFLMQRRHETYPSHTNQIILLV